METLDPIQLMKDAQKTERARAAQEAESARAAQPTDGLAVEGLQEATEVQDSFNAVIKVFLEQMEWAGNPGTSTYFFEIPKDAVSEQEWLAQHICLGERPFGDLIYVAYQAEGWQIGKYLTGFTVGQTKPKRQQKAPKRQQKAPEDQTEAPEDQTEVENGIVLLPRGPIGSTRLNSDTPNFIHKINGDYERADPSDYTQVLNMNTAKSYLTQELVRETAKTTGLILLKHELEL